jgi:hypothetical protein
MCAADPGLNPYLGHSWAYPVATAPKQPVATPYGRKQTSPVRGGNQRDGEAAPLVERDRRIAMMDAKNVPVAKSITTIQDFSPGSDGQCHPPNGSHYPCFTHISNT